ncbi:MAG: hypothetical protein CML33_09015 [Rhodobacteraceae bacterium]|nr:hypothetical protein [Paracoccaceae bacterium]
MLCIFLVTVLELEISGAVAGSLIGVLIAIFYAATTVPHHTGVSFKFNSKLFLEMGRYASNYYLNTVIGYFQQNITSLICALFLGPSQVAFYALGKSMCDVSTRMVPTAINTALFPHVTRLEDELESASLVARLFRITLLILTCTSVLLTIAITPLVNVLYGVNYLPIISPFLIIIPGVVLSQSATIFSQFFSGVGRPDLLPKASIFPLGLQIFLAIILIPEYGVGGAAVSFSASATCLFCFQVALFLRLSKVSIDCLLPVQDDIRSIWIGSRDQLMLYRDKMGRWL